MVANAGYYYHPARGGRASHYALGRMEVANRLYIVRKHNLSVPLCYFGLGIRLFMTLIGAIAKLEKKQMLRRLCAENARWVIVEGQKTGEEKALLLTSHRFGIHARDREAFGIGVVEMLKAGCIPFVPDRGGPPEIVGEPGLCYADVDDGVTKIDAVLRDELRQRQLAAALAERSRNSLPCGLWNNPRVVRSSPAGGYDGFRPGLSRGKV